MTRLVYISVCLRTRQDTISYSSDIYSSKIGTSKDVYGKKTKDDYGKKTSMAKDKTCRPMAERQKTTMAKRQVWQKTKDDYGNKTNYRYC